MLMRLYVAAIHGSNEQGEYCSSGSAAIHSEPQYKLSTLLYLLYFYPAMGWIINQHQ